MLFSIFLIPLNSIFYNVMVAIKIIHYMKRKTKGNDNCVTLKLDIIKAYDMIAWEYMQEQMSKWVLERGGFSE
jgi:hypothetical protein